jgi:hypothetical protein
MGYPISLITSLDRASLVVCQEEGGTGPSKHTDRHLPLRLKACCDERYWGKGLPRFLPEKMPSIPQTAFYAYGSARRFCKNFTGGPTPRSTTLRASASIAGSCKATAPVTERHTSRVAL